MRSVRFKVDVVDNQVDILAGELDARHRDLLEGAENARQEDGRDVLPEVATVDADEVVASLAELGERVAEVLEGVSDGFERAVVSGVVEELAGFVRKGVGIPLPVGIALDDLARAVVQRVELTARAVRRDVARVVDRAFKQRLELGPDLLDALVVADVPVQLVASLERAVERSGERLDDLAQQADGVFGLLVRFGLDVLELGGRLFGSLLELVDPLVGVLAPQTVQGVDGVLVLGLALDLVGNVAPALDHGVLDIGRELLVDIVLELLGRGCKVSSGRIFEAIKGRKGDALRDPS